MIKTRLLQYKFILIAVLIYGVTFILDGEAAIAAVNLFFGFIKEMVQILPPIMILTALIGVWVSRETIVKGFGSGSAWRGRLLSLALGTFSAGPIYAAFPAAAMLLSKGASVSNVVIIISSWAVVKLPMLITEASFLGLSFAVTRYVLTIPMILLLGWIIEKQVSSEDFPFHKKAEKIEKINEGLPQLNCKRCGYASCSEFAEAILDGYKNVNDCAIIAKRKGHEEQEKKQ